MENEWFKNHHSQRKHQYINDRPDEYVPSVGGRDAHLFKSAERGREVGVTSRGYRDWVLSFPNFSKHA
jgi:hypothetical protein